MALIKAVQDRCESSTQGLALCLSLRLELGLLAIFLAPLRPEPMLVQLPLDSAELHSLTESRRLVDLDPGVGWFHCQ